MIRSDFIWESIDKDFLSDIETGSTPTTLSSTKGEADLPKSKEIIIPTERVAFALFPLFIEMIDQFMDTLKTLGTHTRILPEELGAKEFGAYLSRKINEEMKAIELLQNNLFNYIRINNPTIRTDTVNTLIEAEFKKIQGELEEKKIKQIKKLEKDLPETAVPDDQLRYILGGVFQHAMTVIPQNGYFGLLSRSLTLQKEAGKGQASLIEEKSVEILLFYPGYKKPAEEIRTPLAPPLPQKAEKLDLALRLVEEVVKRNRGMMAIDVDEKKGKRTVSLRFPVERRKVVCYPPAAKSSSNVHPFKTTFEKLSSLGETGNRG